MDLYSLPSPVQELVQAELKSGEQIRWLSQPLPRSSFPWVTLFPFFFGIPWTLFALFWTAAVSGVFDPANGFKGFGQLEPGRLVFALFGIPFILVGLVMLSSPWWIRWRLRRGAERTVYLITNQRAIIIDGGFYGDSNLAGAMGVLVRFLGKGTRIRSYGPDQLRNIERIQREDGSGDIIFGEVLFTIYSGYQHQATRAGFFSIRDVKEVEELLRSLAKAVRGGEG